MESINSLIDLMNQYITKQLQEPSFLDNTVQYYIPILGFVILFVTAIAGVIKYYGTKNAEINETILKEVYTPLYSYFVKQELYRKIHKLQTNSEEVPILEITRTKTTIRGSELTRESEPFCKLNRKEILRVLDSINTGLASKELVTLLNMYQIVVEMENNYDNDTNEYLEATILKVEVEKALRNEILLGFNYYYSKLGLKSSSKSGLWALKSNNIEFTYAISEGEKLVLKNAIKANPEKYNRLTGR